MTDERSRPSLPRLAQLDPTLGEVLHAAETEYRRDLDESRAWKRLDQRLAEAQPSPSVRRLMPVRQLLSVVALAAAFLLGWFGWPRAWSVSAPVTVVASKLAQSTAAASSVTSLHLAPGRSRLADGTFVELGGGAEGIFVSDEQRSTLSFGTGRVEVVAAHQPNGRHLAVQTQGFEFRVLGTRFSVEVAGPLVSLDVAEGRVGVHGPNRPPKVIEAGGHWSNLDDAIQPPVVRESEVKERSEPTSAEEAAEARQTPSRLTLAEKGTTMRPSSLGSANPTQSEHPSPSAAIPKDLTTCRDRLAAGEPRHAEDCYRAIAAGTGLSAEMALYEIARLRRDVLSTPTAALDALDEYRSRFAGGTLSPEVQLARVDVLARLGRVEEALQASQVALEDPQTASRRSELRLLRGNLMRDRLRDCTAAIAEYRQLEMESGPRGDQAQYALATCLERLGRNAEAREAYRKYLERTNPRQGERARQRLKELEP